MASKLRVELASVCNQTSKVETVKAGLDHCVKLCDDLLHKVKQSDVEFMETRSSMDPLEMKKAKLMKSGMPQSTAQCTHVIVKGLVT